MTEAMELKPNRSSIPEEECRKAQSLFMRMAHALREASNGVSLYRACKDWGLDSIAVRQLMTTRAFERCPINQDDAPGFPKLEDMFTGYERLYRDVFRVE